MLSELFPKAVLPYAKAGVAFIGFIFTTVSVQWSGAPSWVAPVGSVVTAIAVYLIPNLAYEGRHGGDEEETPDLPLP